MNFLQTFFWSFQFRERSLMMSDFTSLIHLKEPILKKINSDSIQVENFSSRCFSRNIVDFDQAKIS